MARCGKMWQDLVRWDKGDTARCGKMGQRGHGKMWQDGTRGTWHDLARWDKGDMARSGKMGQGGYSQAHRLSVRYVTVR